MPQKNRKKAEATLENMRRVFSIPQSDSATLMKIERDISTNLLGFMRQHTVAGEMEPAQIEQEFRNVSIPEDPMYVNDQAQFLMDKVVSQSVHTASPSFIGHMTSSMPYFMFPLAKIMIALNQNIVKIETSKAFTPLESQVVGMLHNFIYRRNVEFYDRWTHHRAHAFGVFCSGGTIANVTGLWVARNRLLAPRGGFRGIKEDGLAAGLTEYGYNKLVILVSTRGHYSLKKAADILGIGRANLIAIPTDEHNKINVNDLREKIAELKASKAAIMALVGIAGTTETGNVDPLTEMADIAAEHKIHFHVDGAWGAPTLFSDRHRHLLAGIERADSVVIDAHKQLYVPVGAGVCVFKNEKALDAVETSAQYIVRRGSRDLGKHTLEGSRAGMAMLVHSGLRIIGRKGYEILIDMGIALAAEFAEMIQKDCDFELTTAPELNILTYRYVPEALQSKLATMPKDARIAVNSLLSELTVNIQKTQRDRGLTFVSRTTFEIASQNKQSLTVFRAVLANPLTTRQVFVDVLAEQRAIAGEEMLKMNFDAELKRC
jgi:glutamate decarboxylase